MPAIPKNLSFRDSQGHQRPVAENQKTEDAGRGPSLALDYFVNAALCSCCDGGSVGASIRGGGEMTDEKLERRQREREAMRQAIAAYTGPITKCPPGTSPNVLPRRRQGEQKKTPTGSSENTP